MQGKSAVLQSTAKSCERVGKPYSSEVFKRELCRAVQSLSLPESAGLPNAVQIYVRQNAGNAYISLYRTKRGVWVTEKSEENEP
ncbi:MAG: hypothetical protein RSB36_08050 [Hydrogenoanaerobacterium sp.]